MKVLFVPVFEDNYSYLLVNSSTNEAVAVDPAEPAKVLAEAQKQGLTIKSIFTTHHHWDHANGNVELAGSLEENAPVYGGDERIPAMTHKVSQGDEFEVIGVKVRILSAPCHTTGHVLYYIEKNENQELQPTLFTGDTLFVASCGKFFEGTADQMYDNFFNKIMKLPEDTSMYPGHEYSVANLKWAISFDKDNEALKEKLDWCLEQREKGLPTLPTTLKGELSYNPFLRLDSPSILDYTSLTAKDSPISVFNALRELKNNFK